MSVRFGSIVVLLAAALAGCGSGIHKAAPPPPPAEVTPGSTFTVIRGFLVPSGDTSVFFQDARLYPQGDIRPDFPYCEFIAGAATAAGVVIGEGVYTVSSVTYDESAAGPGDADASVTSLHLKESVSGNHYQMDCMLPRLSRGAIFVTPAEIHGAVAGYMHLKVAP